MKRCDYCGKEYSDEAVVCDIDQNPLPEILKSAEGSGTVPPYIQRMDSAALYPEYRWTARDGWKFVGTIILLWAMWYSVMGALYVVVPGFYDWRWRPYGFVVVRCAFIAMNLLTAAYFTRTATWSSFCEAVGLNKRPTHYVWFGVVAALGLRFLGHVAYVLGWHGGYTAHDIRAFETTHGQERYLYLFGLLAAAFAEEPVYRGFLYKAFRGSFSMTASVFIVLGYTVFTHWAYYSHLSFAVISLSGLAVVQCYLREKTGSLWDCIFCHLVFNASSLFVSGILRH